jgi:chromosome segregation ATPase
LDLPDFQEIQQSANALKEMHAQCDALESDVAALFTDKLSRQTQHKSQLAGIRDDLASEQHRLQEMRGENDQWKQALDALQAKINKVKC